MEKKLEKQTIGTQSQVLEGIEELKKLNRYYINEAKQNLFHINNDRNASPEEKQYYAGRHEAYSDHIAETQYIIEMMEGTR